MSGDLRVAVNQRNPTESRHAARQQQGKALQQKEATLGRLASEGNKEEFFRQLIPFLRPIQDYIKRRLRIAYHDLQIRTPVATSGDLLDEVVLEAYENYDRKPADLSLEQWLYQITNKKVDAYIAKQSSREKRRRSLETLNQKELRTLEEMPITADADAEPWLPEDLDDSEIQPLEFNAPADTHTPEEELERKEWLQLILQALARVPQQDLVVFDLFAIEGLPKESVAKIAKVPPDEVPRIAERVKENVLREVEAEQGSAERKAS
jgi:RNA polymerase sigma factor (sigma-70 family)